jgi:hypothetical protein
VSDKLQEERQYADSLCDELVELRQVHSETVLKLISAQSDAARLYACATMLLPRTVDGTEERRAVIVAMDAHERLL